MYDQVSHELGKLRDIEGDGGYLGPEAERANVKFIS